MGALAPGAGGRAISLRRRDLWLCVPASRRVCPCQLLYPLSSTVHTMGFRPHGRMVYKSASAAPLKVASALAKRGKRAAFRLRRPMSAAEPRDPAHTEVHRVA